MRIAVVLLLLLSAARASAQAPPETKLVIQQGGRETGQEEYSLRPGRSGGPDGTTLIANARYPATNPTLKLAAKLELTGESALAKFQLDVEGPGGTTVILAAGSGARLIVRTVAKGSEAGRELPGGPDVVLLDEGVFSLYTTVVNLATPGGRTLTAVFPRTGRRASLVARRESGNRVTLSGDISGTLVTDTQGRLQRLEFPESGIIVARAQD